VHRGQKSSNLAEDIHKKYIILDIMAYDDDDRQYNIEMQAAKVISEKEYTKIKFPP